MDFWSSLIQSIAWLGVIFLMLVLGVVLLPVDIHKLASHPRPVGNYDQALQRIDDLRTSASDRLNPACLPQFMTHGHKVEHAIVFAHGYTNCPKQFQALGEAFHSLGYNVLIAPLPHHGLADRMTTEHKRLTANELAAYADTVVDIAQGLGERIILAGLSGGGVVTAWAAQFRSDLDLAVLIAPAFGFALIPTPLTDPAMKLFRWLPNFYRWWDPKLKEAIGPTYAYPRTATRALVGILYLGYAVRIAARRDPPAARAVLVVTNANDTSVNNALTSQVVDLWQGRGAKNLRTYEFDASLGLDHDLIDPSQPDQRTDIVYPKLIELINN
jgi:alpha-beta hydrolase superfamily lysophospholipase